VVLIIGITGGSGVIYGIRLLEILKSMKNVETHLVISQAGESVIKQETHYSVAKVRRLASFHYDINDMTASICSGSFQRDGMIVAPCTMKTLAAIANSYADNLLVRAADVNLKEKKPLILMARETPLHQGHLRNMLQLAEMGAVILPPVPGFYQHPKTIGDIVDHTIARVLDLLGIPHDLSSRWEGTQGI
jgi:4-hydroxy-3-polyprenylbenzoate decarboxylase